MNGEQKLLICGKVSCIVNYVLTVLDNVFAVNGNSKVLDVLNKGDVMVLVLYSTFRRFVRLEPCQV